MSDSFRAAVWKARRQDGLYFAALLAEDRILEAVREARATFQGWIYRACDALCAGSWRW